MTAILKWAGGKRSLVQAILSTFPPGYEDRAYHEPFLGGGAVFFAVKPRRGTVNDVNPRLTNFYRVVRDRPAELIAEALKYPYEKETYYRLRGRFNERGLDAVEDAALLLYLNKTGYNGLYRVNSRGIYNVPFGTYRNPTIVPEEDIYAASEALRRVELRSEDFSYLLDAAREGDIVYLDPPYEPTSRTSNFNTYNPTGFPWGEQVRLSETIRELDARGVLFVLSNSEPVKKLYRGYRVRIVHANRSINTKTTARGPVREIIVTNIKNLKLRLKGSIKKYQTFSTPHRNPCVQTPDFSQHIRFINSELHPANMSKDEVEGKSKKIKGQIREKVGKITDNKTEQIKGKLEQVEGIVQEEIGKVKNMSKDEVEGRGKKIKGQIREEIGKITDNKTEQIKGKIEQVQGKAQEEIGKVKRKAKE